MNKVIINIITVLLIIITLIANSIFNIIIVNKILNNQKIQDSPREIIIQDDEIALASPIEEENDIQEPQGFIETYIVQTANEQNVVDIATIGKTQNIQTNIDLFEIIKNYYAEQDKIIEKEKLDINYSYNNLTKEQKEFYQDIKQFIYQIDKGYYSYEKTYGSIDEIDSYIAVFNILLDNSPEIYWIEPAITIGSFDEKTISTIGFLSFYSEEERKLIDEEIDKKIKPLIRNINNTTGDYAKICIIADWFKDNIKYSYNLYETQNIDSVFIKQESCCAGISKAFKYICGKISIPCIVDSGYIINSSSEIIGYHSWNIALVNGTLTYFDITWYIQFNNKEWLGTDPQTFEQDHKSFDNIIKPVSNRYDYDNIIKNFCKLRDEPQITQETLMAAIIKRDTF